MTPVATSLPSGRFVLRMPPPLHELLRGESKAAGLSLNEYCVRRLTTGGLVEEDAVTLVSRCTSVLGGGFAALLLHGSWVRGDASAGSDVDALIVVRPEVALDRSLYREWDAQPLRWRGLPVDPHFVHLPAPDTFSGLWAEVATHGLTLFDRDGQLGLHLARVRSAIADGRLRRRFAHGQPYWAGAA